MAKKKGLGKGLSSLIPEKYEELDINENPQSTNVRNINIGDIWPNPNQPRKKFEKLAMQDLKDSIESHGLLQPIIVVREGAKFVIVAGERRWRALRELGHKTIPTIVRTLDEQKKLETSLIENLQREDLDPLEVAETLSKLASQFSIAIKELSKRVGKAPTTISNIIRLLNLPQPAKKALSENQISEGHARAILMLDGNLPRQQLLLDYIIRNGWSVRQAEQFAAESKKKSATKGLAKTATTNQDTALITRKIGASVPVRIHHMAKGRGRIIIEFKNDQEYKIITKKILTQVDF